jgi:uncharacterized membrane protein
MGVYEGSGRAAVAPPGVLPSDSGRLLARLSSVGAASLFLALALPVGLFLVFAVPPFQGLDEPNHFLRAVSISGGAFVAPVVDGRSGDILPACVTSYTDEVFHSQVRPGRFGPGQGFVEPAGCASQPAAFVPFDNTAVYSPVSYLPQAAGVALARVLGAPVPVWFYAGRVAILLFYVAVVALALRVAPIGEQVLLVVALMPMSLVLGTQFSADGVTIASSLLLVAAVAHSRWDEGATGRSFLLVVAAALVLALSKSTYFVLAPLLLLVPGRLFPNRWAAAGAKMAGLGLIAALAVLWYLQVQGIHPAGPTVAGIDPGQQVRFMLRHPGWSARFVLLTLFGPQTGYFTWPGFVSWVGFSRSLTAGVPSPPPLVMAAGIGLLVMAYVHAWPRRMIVAPAAAVRAALPLVLVVANAVLIVVVLEVTVQPVGDPTLWLQGRYLLPLAAVPVLSPHLMLAEPGKRRSLLPLVPLMLLLLGYLVVKVLVYFYR